MRQRDASVDMNRPVRWETPEGRVQARLDRVLRAPRGSIALMEPEPEMTTETETQTTSDVVAPEKLGDPDEEGVDEEGVKPCFGTTRVLFPGYPFARVEVPDRLIRQ